MSYASNPNQLASAEVASEALHVGTVAKPRVWTVFTTVLLALMMAIVAQVIVVCGLLFIAAGKGQNLGQASNNLAEDIMAPPAFIALLVLSQLLMGLTTIAAAMRSATPLLERLSLRAPKCPWWTLALFPMASAIPLAVGVGAAYGMTYFFTPDNSIEALYKNMTTAWAIPFIILIGIMPGMMEELLFRGYVLTRLIERWGPLVGISVTTILFALFHVTPHAMVLAFILGIWLGILAWRTGSIWSGVICHAFINSTWNVWQVGQRLWGLPENLAIPTWVVSGALATAVFTFACWVLMNNRYHVVHESN